MSATGFLDACGFNPASGGTGDFVVSAAVTGYQTPAGAGAVNGAVYSYRAQSSDLSQWEIGYGAYATGTTTLARTTVVASSTGSKVNFSAPPSVYITALTADLLRFKQISVQKFTTSGTYTPSAGTIYAVIECIGGGGAGGGVAGATTYGVAAGGGGAGAYSRTVASAATIGASQTVTIGAGGAPGAAGANAGGNGGQTSVGALCTAPGGSGGSAASSGGVLGGGGSGGAVGTGDLTVPGARGSRGQGTFIAPGYNVVSSGGGGANSPYGSGGDIGVAFANASAGSAATGYGAGGGGAAAQNSTATAAGGAGAPGLVIITEFLG